MSVGVNCREALRTVEKQRPCPVHFIRRPSSAADGLRPFGQTWEVSFCPEFQLENEKSVFQCP